MFLGWIAASVIGIARWYRPAGVANVTRDYDLIFKSQMRHIATGSWRAVGILSVLKVVFWAMALDLSSTWFARYFVLWTTILNPGVTGFWILALWAFVGVLCSGMSVNRKREYVGEYTLIGSRGCVTCQASCIILICLISLIPMMFGGYLTLEGLLLDAITMQLSIYLGNRIRGTKPGERLGTLVVTTRPGGLESWEWEDE
jgi:hypothetical protein